MIHDPKTTLKTKTKRTLTRRPLPGALEVARETFSMMWDVNALAFVDSHHDAVELLKSVRDRQDL